MNNEIDKKAYLSTLFSYYKNLLTEKQQELFISYYDEDYSLAEIAESYDISRNAVWDTLKKVSKILEDYEEKLGLYQKDVRLNECLKKLKEHCDLDGQNIIDDILEME